MSFFSSMARMLLGALGAREQVLAIVCVKEFTERLDTANNHQQDRPDRRARTRHRPDRAARPARGAGPSGGPRRRRGDPPALQRSFFCLRRALIPESASRALRSTDVHCRESSTDLSFLPHGRISHLCSSEIFALINANLNRMHRKQQQRHPNGLSIISLITPSAARRNAYGSFDPVGFSSIAQKPTSVSILSARADGDR